MLLELGWGHRRLLAPRTSALAVNAQLPCSEWPSVVWQDQLAEEATTIVATLDSNLGEQGEIA
jgi:hypothetical protein